MYTDADFLARILEAPDDDTPRLVYADYLDGIGQGERAEFIRLHVAAERPPESALRSAIAKNDLMGVWLRHWRVISAGLPTDEATPYLGIPAVFKSRPAGGGREFYYGFTRGLVEEVTFSWEAWQAHADALLTAQPVRTVIICTPIPMDERPGPGGAVEYRLEGREGAVWASIEVHRQRGRAPFSATDSLLSGVWPQVREWVLETEEAESELTFLGIPGINGAEVGRGAVPAAPAPAG